MEEELNVTPKDTVKKRSYRNSTVGIEEQKTNNNQITSNYEKGDFFITISIEMNSSSYFTAYLRDKYRHLLGNLKGGDENIQILCANPE